MVVAALFLVALPRCVTDNNSAAPLDAGSTDAAGPFAVSGTVSGLPAGGTVTLTLDGQNPISTGNGPFAFPATLHTGDAYTVAATAVTAGSSCVVQNGTGTVAGADVTGVDVRCGSANAALASLSISQGELAPAFTSDTLAYTTSIRVSALFPPPTTITVTATTSAPNATITVAGTKATSGSPSAPIALKSGVDAIDVTVTAPDGTTQRHYAIAVTAIASDYLKASNTRAAAKFGTSVALSGDGTTLVVGSPYETSGANTIDGDQTDTSTMQAGAVYVFVRSGGTWAQQTYVKASNTAFYWFFGYALALSSDGNTLAVGAYGDNSSSTGVNGSEAPSMSDVDSGAVFVYTRAGTAWSQQAYVKPSNTTANILFGISVALSSDGNRLAVGGFGESSNATGVGGVESDTSATYAGAVYVFTRTGTTWAQEAYVKASNTRANAYFYIVALSGDGNTLAVGSPNESSNAKGVNGVESDTSVMYAGAVYVFARSGTTWAQEAYVKASNTSSVAASFGASVALSGDGNTLAVGAPGESSNAMGVNGNQTDTSASQSGALYIFTRAGTAWSQQAYVKASNTESGAKLGTSVRITSDGNTLVAGAPGEQSAATGVGGDQNDKSASGAGAAYVFARTGTSWVQSAYVKSSNTAANQGFATSVSLSADGKSMVAGAIQEGSKATGVNGDQKDTSASTSGAAYAF
jgi:hypothetical protein